MKNLKMIFALVTIASSTHALCPKSELNSKYIPKLREVADWSDEMLLPYAKQWCLLDKQKASLQSSINSRSQTLRSGNWRICKEVIPGTPNPTDSECKAAYTKKVNDLIDQCQTLVGMGHNPHNVMLYIDPLMVEVACLKGVNTALK